MSEISADNYLDRPIEDLLFCAARLVYRISAMSKMLPEQLDSPLGRKVMKTDEQMRVAYRTALLLRVDEICRLAESRGYRCRRETAKQNPFAVACVLYPEDPTE